MKIIIPMAGTGQRFVEAGYTVLKPFIKAGGRMIIDHILDMFDRKNDEFFFVVNGDTARDPWAMQVLNDAVRKKTIYSCPMNSAGPVFSMFNAHKRDDPNLTPLFDDIDDEEEVIVTYCDNPYLWDYPRFLQYVDTHAVEGVILSHKGFHPHRLGSTYMAYMKINNSAGDLRVQEIKEKEPYTQHPMREHASTGTYYFRKGHYIKRYFEQLIIQGMSHSNGEFYVTLVYNLMIQDGMYVTAYPSNHVAVFGTPAELENFNAWQKILERGQVKTPIDLQDVHDYWSQYNFLSSCKKRLRG
jgi:NDP-sugar pyrophosphorylase family protein